MGWAAERAPRKRQSILCKYSRQDWEFKRRQREQGFTPQKEYVRSIYNDKNVSPIVAYLVWWISFRAEQNVSAADFYSTSSQNVGYEHGFAWLSQIVLGNCPPLDVNNAASVLAYLNNLPLVDRYLYLVAILHTLVSFSQESSLLQTIFDSIAPIYKMLDDPQLERLALAVGHSPRRSIVPPPELASLDANLQGNYGSSIDLAAPIIERQGSIDALKIYLESHIAEGLDLTAVLSKYHPESLIHRIATDLSEIICLKPQADDATARLEKIIVTNSSTEWSSTLILILERQKNDERLFPPNQKQIFHSLRVQANNPILALTYAVFDKANEYLENFFGHSGKSESCCLIRGIYDPKFENLLIELPESRKIKYMAFKELNFKSNESAVELLRPIHEMQMSGGLLQQNGAIFAESLLRAGYLQDCVEVCFGLVSQINYLGKLLPLGRLF